MNYKRILPFTIIIGLIIGYFKFFKKNNIENINDSINNKEKSINEENFHESKIIK
jgi:hypothetical protein